MYLETACSYRYVLMQITRCGGRALSWGHYRGLLKLCFLANLHFELSSASDTSETRGYICV